MRTVPRVLTLAAFVSVLLSVTGCGATVSTYLILSAQAEMDGAEAAEAQKYAPYEYRSAAEYLHKAREEQGYADFGPSIEYAFKAQEMAEKGKKKALEARNRDIPPEGVPTTTTITSSPEDTPPVDQPAPQKVIIQRVAPAPTPDEPAEPVEVPIAPIAPKGNTP